jgi:hypothetical protein
MTHKERILKAIRGEMADRLAFAPRLDLWHSANEQAGTLPSRYKSSTPDQIARAEGWALHKMNPEYQKPRKPEDNLHWALGILSFKEFQPDILGLSSLLTTTMPQMKLVIQALADAGLREGVKVMVGGAPVNGKYASDIGEDGYAHDAGGGVKLVERFLQGV